ncbi:MAG: hypothetical protein NTY72_10645 [Bacteroidetes bacterium]|nr:hypothetical protein [Bacteroidota bacterium]
MKLITAIFLTAFLAFAIGLFTFLPWWSFVFTSFIVSVAIHQKPGIAFVAGFSGLFILWTLLAVLKDTANEHILSTKVAHLFPLGGSYLLLILITGLLAGLVSGLAALTGSNFRKTSNK